MPVRRGRGRRGGRTRGPAAKRRRIDNNTSGSEISSSSINDIGLNNPSSSTDNPSPQSSNVISSNIGSLVRILTNDSIIIWTDNNFPADSSSSVNVDSSSSLRVPGNPRSVTVIQCPPPSCASAEVSLPTCQTVSISSSENSNPDLSSSVPDIPGSIAVIQSPHPSCADDEVSLQTVSISSSGNSNVESVTSSQATLNSVAVSSSDDTSVTADSQNSTSSQNTEETSSSASTVCASSVSLTNATDTNNSNYNLRPHPGINTLSSDQAVPLVNNNDIEAEAGPSQESQSEDSKDKRDGLDGDECPVCLQACVHPAKLPCSHVFCYLCLKGIARAGQSCPMCRAPIPIRYADHPDLISSQATVSLPADCDEADRGENYCWFYQGRHGGWWQFEKRMSEEIEENFNSNTPRFEMMICGSMYVIDTISCIQYPKYYPTRSRRLLRELPSRVDKKGVAGIHGGH